MPEEQRESANDLQRAHGHVLHGYARLIELTAQEVAASGLQTLEDAERFLAVVGRHLRGATFTVESLRELVFAEQRAETEHAATERPSVEPQECDRCPQCRGALTYLSHATGARPVCLECTGGE